MRPFYEIVLRPLVTEKSVSGRAISLYSFQVAKDATKGLIRQAVEDFFKVKVETVRTMTVHGKRRRFGKHTGTTPPWKKAVVKLKAGQKIEMLEAD